MQVSATSHWPADARQVKLPDWYASTQELLDPVQWSAASLSQVPPWEAPRQLVEDDAKTLAGQAPEVPVQVSATSHWPAEGRQVKLEDWKTSTHVLAVPEQ